ncbi:MAG TPA: NADH-quinone oxidoreductase subunit NuoE [Clostridia bacterium]|nr:NADH-quinone oxidoreductase subunit NuoE [Clostridia bacterium]
MVGARDRHFSTVNEIIEKYDNDPHALISILQAVQEEYRYLPPEILTYIATALGLPPSSVFGVASFYAQFSMEPKGKWVIRICDGTACHVRRSKDILQAVRKKLGLKEGERTTKDMLFSLETVACLGACGLAPVMTVGDEVHGQMTPDKAVTLIDEILRREVEAA